MIGICLTLLDDNDDKKAFEQLYYSQYKKLYVTALKILNDPYLAEDAVSETFLYVAKCFGRLGGLPEDSLKAYCAVAVSNFSKNIIRSVSRETTGVCDVTESDRFISDDELKNIDVIFLKEKISELKYEYQELLMLYYVYRCNIKEIAKLKKLSYNTVKKYLHNARAQLKALMEAEYAEN